MPDPNTPTPKIDHVKRKNGMPWQFWSEAQINDALLEYGAEDIDCCIQNQGERIAELEIENADLRQQLEGANLRADDAHLSCIAAEEERELLRGRHAAGVIKWMRRLHKELGTLKWMGADEGWELAIAAVREHISAEVDLQTAGGTTEPGNKKGAEAPQNGPAKD